MLAEGAHVGLTAPDQHGQPYTVPAEGLAVVWWYVKALTPGCASCGEGFQLNLHRFAAHDCQVVGVSFDEPSENLAFAGKHRMAFPLLSASEDQAREWGALRDPSDPWAGLPARASYLLRDGVVIRAWDVRDPKAHPGDVADVLDLL
jgi:peroxiredoxin Q/BCP